MGNYRWKKDKTYRVLAGVLAAGMSVQAAFPARAMDAPGGGGEGWVYSQDDYHWYYYDEEKQVHTGWLDYEGEWYWFDQEGRMAEGGYLNVDGLQYYFFINGNMAWNQYVGMKYFDKNGQEEPVHDIRVVGSEQPTNEDKDLLSDELYSVPRGWIAQFVRDGWQLMFYKKKNYFAAPNTDQGIYYVYHSTDTHYKKVKFTETDAVLQGFGEYVGYAAGCFDEDDERMKALWEEYQALESFLEIPSYYSSDAGFYFGKLFASYLDEEERETLERLSPRACEVMDEILHMKDDPGVLARRRAREAEQAAEAAKRLAREVPEENYGPGLARAKEESGEDGENTEAAAGQAGKSSTK